MRNNETLKVGQVIEYQKGLWRVDLVNACRARIVPLKKRHVVLKHDDGTEKRAFDAEYGGVNISPTSAVPIVHEDDVADELALLKQEQHAKPAPAAGPTANVPQAQATRVPAGKIAPRGANPPFRIEVTKKGGGWYRTTMPSTFRPGSLGEVVMAHIEAHPGQDTKAIVAALPNADGNVASCVSRFMQAGLIEKK